MAAAFKDVGEVAQSFERVDPSLGGKDKGRVPDARDRGARTGGSHESKGTGDDRRALMPSTDLASYAAGAASGDATVNKDPATGIVEKTWTTRNDDGTTTVHTSAYDPHAGSSTSTQTTRNNDGTTHRVLITDGRDGSSEGETSITDRHDSVIVRHNWRRDPGGHLVQDYWQMRDRSGQVVEQDRGADRRRGLARLPTEDAGSELGRRLGARFSHGATKPAPVVTQVNPGERDDSGPRAPKINLGKKIAVNPGIEAGNQAREAGAARLKHWQRQLRDKVGGQVNPPGPGRGKS